MLLTIESSKSEDQTGLHPQPSQQDAQVLAHVLDLNVFIYSVRLSPNMKKKIQCDDSGLHTLSLTPDLLTNVRQKQTLPQTKSLLSQLPSCSCCQCSQGLLLPSPVVLTLRQGITNNWGTWDPTRVLDPMPEIPAQYSWGPE